MTEYHAEIPLRHYLEGDGEGELRPVTTMIAVHWDERRELLGAYWQGNHYKREIPLDLARVLTGWNQGGWKIAEAHLEMRLDEEAA